MMRALCIVILLSFAASACSVSEPARLRVDMASLSEGPCGQSAAPQAARRAIPLVRLERLTSLPGLDRMAVQQNDGGVLTDLPAMAFEGPPAELVGRALERTVGCSPQIGLAGLNNTRAKPRLEVHGAVEAFEVRAVEAGGYEFVAALALQGWTPAGREQLAATVLRSGVPLQSLEPAAVARAAQAAVADLADQSLGWMLATVHNGR